MRNALLRYSALLLLAATGCQSQPGAASTPFLAADRVPPPATRNPAPGTALPYYPNSPAPAAPMGAGVQQPMPAQVASAPQRVGLPVTGVPISLPSDTQPLRMSAPERPGIVALPPSSMQNPQMASPSPEFTPPPADAALAWGGGAPQPAAVQQAYAPAPFLPQPAQQASYVANATPRVRLPGYAAPPSYAAPQTMPTGQVQVTELPAPAYAAPQTAVVTGDGFRPRGASQF